MRPVRLEIEGFTCFREKQTIDFQRLGLFAIAGPTGAGKSSILDAMVFALFGQIPRVGKHGVTEFISLGRDRMNVLFEFEVGGARYKVARVAYRAQTRPTKVQLERGSAGIWLPVADSVKGVAEEVERVLGLNHDTFQQSVLLPQGQFSKFLKAAPRDQRLILRNLLRIGVYEVLRKRASERASQAENAADALRRRIDEDYGGVSTDAVAQIDAKQQALGEQIVRDGLALTTRRTALEALSARCKAWNEVRKYGATLANLEGEASRIAEQAGRLAEATRARHVLPWAEAADVAHKAAQEADKASAKAAGIVDEKRKKAMTSARTLAEADAAAAPTVELQDKIQRLEGVLALLPQLAEWKERAAKEESAVKAGETNVGSLKTAMETATEDMRKHAEAVAELDLKTAELAYDPAAHERLLNASALGGKLTAARKAATEASAEHERAQRVKNDADGAFVEAQQVLERATGELDEATRDVETARSAREQGERLHQAHVLREHLVAGEPCPVCTKPVDSVPPVVSVPLVDELRAQEVKADGKVKRAQAAHTTASGTVAAKREGLTKAKQQEERSREVAAQRAEERNTLEAELMGLAIVPEGPGVIEIRLESRLRELKALAEKHRKLMAERSNREEQRREAERALGLATSGHGTVVGELAKTRERLEKAQEGLAALAAQVRAVTTADDPAAEQRQLKERVRLLVKAVEDAKLHDERCREELTKAVAAREAQETAAREAIGRASEASQRAENEARVAEFANLAAARAAILGPAEHARIEQRVTQWRTDREGTKALLSEAMKQAGEGEVTDAMLAAERSVLGQDERALAEQQKALGTLQADLKVARANLATAERLEREYQEKRTEHGLYDTIARDLRTDGFEKWLLDGTFKALVDGASVRLFEMSGRYTLAYRDDEFYVVDHDNARELRKADTLSGGETFLASLCLALQLSEQVQRASGAVRLDSLFIDEGFGTLDPETLDTVAGAIETLGGHDRMVGIITHVPELTARLPARLQVNKTASGSSIAVVEP